MYQRTVRNIMVRISQTLFQISLW